MFKLAFYIIFLIYFVNCESANFLGTTRVSWVNTGLKSEFYVTSTLSGLDLNDAWLAVGFNNKNIMSDANVIICRNGPLEKSVKSYISNGYNGVLLIDQYDPQVGLSNIKIELVQKNLSCSFTRENILLVNNYFPLNIDYPPYLLVAYGSGNVSYHGVNKESTSEPINLKLGESWTTTGATTTITTTTPTTTTKTNALLNLAQFLNQLFSIIKNTFKF